MALRGIIPQIQGLGVAIAGYWPIKGFYNFWLRCILNHLVDLDTRRNYGPFLQNIQGLFHEIYKKKELIIVCLPNFCSVLERWQTQPIFQNYFCNQIYSIDYRMEPVDIELDISWLSLLEIYWSYARVY